MNTKIDKWEAGKKSGLGIGLVGELTGSLKGCSGQGGAEGQGQVAGAGSQV